MISFNVDLRKRAELAKQQAAASTIAPAVESYMQGLMETPQQKAMRNMPQRTPEGYNIALPQTSFVDRPGLMSTFIEESPGMDAATRQQVAGLLKAPAQQKPTSLMQNIAAAGYQPGTPGYQQAVKDYLVKPNTQINLGAKNITAADAQQMRNDKGQMPSIGMNWEQAGQAGFRFINKQEEEKAGEQKEIIGSMEQSLTTYKGLLKKQGAMNVLDMFTNPSDYNKLSAAYGQLQLEYKELAKLGVLAGPDMDLIERVMIDPMSMRANAAQYFSDKDTLYKQLDVVEDKLNAARSRAEARFGKNWRQNSIRNVSDDELRRIAGQK